MKSVTFAKRLIAWQKQFGRHDLPWQVRDPYRVWLSEVMLQQTQVATVIPYYQRFLTRFPTLAHLSKASEAEVMPYWAGLGYYTRARNLHQAAQKMASTGIPATQVQLQELPGIGRSTAAAIAVFCFDERTAICDGNVKRVLARHLGIVTPTNTVLGEKKFYEVAHALLPKTDLIAYTQGLMDLGATVCTRSKPKCGQCPVKDDCVAQQEQRIAEFPVKKSASAVKAIDVHLALCRQQQQIALDRRPAKGIWAGLLCLPELSQAPANSPALIIKHRLTHRLLSLHLHEISARPEHSFYPLDQVEQLALPQPIKNFLINLRDLCTTRRKAVRQGK